MFCSRPENRVHNEDLRAALKAEEELRILQPDNEILDDRGYDDEDRNELNSDNQTMICNLFTILIRVL